MKSPRELPGCRAPSPLPQSTWDFHRPQLFPWDNAQASHSYWPCPRKPGNNHAANAPKSSKNLPQGQMRCSGDPFCLSSSHSWIPDHKRLRVLGHSYFWPVAWELTVSLHLPSNIYLALSGPGADKCWGFRNKTQSLPFRELGLQSPGRTRYLLLSPHNDPGLPSSSEFRISLDTTAF